MAVFRLDKFLTSSGLGTRSEVKTLIKHGKITLNGEIIKKSDQKIDTDVDLVCFAGKKITYISHLYLMLNKPKGVVSATEDNISATVIDLIKEGKHLNLFPVGRLDKDTEGLLLITNDGDLAHNLLSPKKHINKKYYAELDSMVTLEIIKVLEEGVDLEEFVTMPSKIETTNDPRKLYITIQEGKFHQVKRMFKAVGVEVTYLKRMSMGSLVLDKSLAPGKYRELTKEELNKLKGDKHDK